MRTWRFYLRCNFNRNCFLSRWLICCLARHLRWVYEILELNFHFTVVPLFLISLAVVYNHNDVNALELINFTWQSSVSFTPLTKPLFLWYCTCTSSFCIFITHSASFLYTMMIWMFSCVDVQSNMLPGELKTRCLAWHFRWGLRDFGKSSILWSFFSVSWANWCLLPWWVS